MPAVAATNPPVLIAMVAAATERIRVGSGGVMLPNHAPLVVAEQFALLEAAYPGRIDLGIGRAPGTDPVTSCALRHGAGGVDDDAVERFPEYVDNIIAMMSPDGVGLQVGRRGSTPLQRHAARDLGAARLAARARRTTRPGWPPSKGLPYVFAHHFSGRGTAEALDALPHRASSPSSRPPRAAHLPDRQRRRGADTQEEADRLALPNLQVDGRAAHRRSRCTRAAARRGGRGARACPSRTGDLAEQMLEPLGGRHARRRPPRSCASSRATYGVDEVMVHPVAGALRGTPADRSPAREETLRLLSAALD